MEKHRPEDNLFKKILENHPDFTPSKSDINDMESRLDAADKTNRKNGFGFWWIPLLLIPFIFATTFLFYKNQKLDSQLQLLNSKLSTIQEDTSTHNFITYHYDTIYKTIYIDEVIERQSRQNYSYQNIPVLNYLSDNSRTLALNKATDFFSSKDNIDSSKPFIYGGSNTFTTLQIYNSSQDKNKFTNDKHNNDPSLENSLLVSKDVLPITTLFSYLGKKENVNLLLEGIKSMYEFKKRRRNPLRHFSPKGFRIGIEGSPYSLTRIRSNNFSPTYSYGLASEIEFNKNVSLLLGLRKMDLTFEEKEPIYTALYPAGMPDDPTDILRELYVTLNQIQVPISIKYIFSNNKKWQPFFSVGLVASRPFQQKFKHKYISTSLEEYELLTSFKEGTFSVKNFEGSFGFETSITEKLFGSASIYYFHDLEINPGEYFLLRNTGVNLSLKYKL